jgi:hypothetical protein
MSLQRISNWVRERITASKEGFTSLSKAIGGVNMMQEIVNAFHKMGFWFLIFFMVGCVFGGYAIHKYQKVQMTESIQIGGFVFDSKVFDVKRRP